MEGGMISLRTEDAPPAVLLSPLLSTFILSNWTKNSKQEVNRFILACRCLMAEVNFQKINSI